MKTVFFFFLLMIAPVVGAIHETSQFEEILTHVDENTLVLLDIDDTILIAPQMLGTDAWLNHQIRERTKDGVDPAEAFTKSLLEWQAIRYITEMELVEPDTGDIIRQLQAKGGHVIGITMQGVALADRTSHHLHIHHIDLSKNAISEEPHCFKLGRRNLFYLDGILYTQGTSKANGLFTLCDKMGYVPKRIVLIDDRESHVQDVEQAAEKRGIEFIGLRYAFSDARKNAFCPHVAHVQYKHSTFHRLLTDEEARKIIEKELQEEVWQP